VVPWQLQATLAGTAELAVSSCCPEVSDVTTVIRAPKTVLPGWQPIMATACLTGAWLQHLCSLTCVVVADDWHCWTSAECWQCRYRQLMTYLVMAEVAFAQMLHGCSPLLCTPAHERQVPGEHQWRAAHYSMTASLSAELVVTAPDMMALLNSSSQMSQLSSVDARCVSFMGAGMGWISIRQCMRRACGACIDVAGTCLGLPYAMEIDWPARIAGRSGTWVTSRLCR
jgi:hypothetical protein